MSMLDGLLGPLEIALNRALSTSPAALEQISSGRGVIGVHFRDLGWGLCVAPVPHGVQLLAAGTPTRANVSTSLVGMARLMAGEDARAMGNALSLDGDAEYAATFMAALRSARFDLEAELRSLLGPALDSIVGQQVSRGVQDVLAFGHSSLQSLLFGRSTTKAGQESLALPDAMGEVADAQQAHAWMDGVDDAASSLDRLEARLARLERERGRA